MSPGNIRVISNYVGGGFGCKAGVTMEALPIILAMKVPGRPVKLRLTREEEFFTNFVRQALVIKLKMGCDKQGNMLAMENVMYWDGGAYTEYGVNITRAGGYSSTGPYDIPMSRRIAIASIPITPWWTVSRFRHVGTAYRHRTVCG